MSGAPRQARCRRRVEWRILNSLLQAAIFANMPAWKRILLKSTGVGLGIGFGWALAFGLYVWYSSRPVQPKPWNSAAITANFLYADAGGDNNHLRFSYIMENHSERDYRVRTSDLVLSAVRKAQSSLTGAGNGEVKLQEDTIFLPAKDRTEVHVLLPEYVFPGERPPRAVDSAEAWKSYHDAVKKYIDEKLPELNGFAAFDDANRYRINFPNGWHTQ
jgi:hypothetical protein